MRSLLVASALVMAAAQPYGPVLNLPGYNMTQEMSSGYITVNESAGRALFFFFVAAASNPSTAPLVMWTNGAVSCFQRVFPEIRPNP
jgi:serine carboxypeptidase-like clade 2